MNKLDLDSANEIAAIIRAELDQRHLSCAVIISYENNDSSDCDIQIVPRVFALLEIKPKN